MSYCLQELKELVERFKASFTNATVQPPTDTEIVNALESLKKVLGEHPLCGEIFRAMNQPKIVLSPQLAHSMATLVEEAEVAIASDPTKKRALEYQPNQIPLKERWSNFLFATALLTYGGLGAKIDDLYIPGKRGNGVHFHGAPAWMMFGALACAAVVLLLTIVDHYDRRDNERHYRWATKSLKMAGWALFGAAFLLDIYAKLRR